MALSPGALALRQAQDASQEWRDPSAPGQGPSSQVRWLPFWSYDQGALARKRIEVNGRGLRGDKTRRMRERRPHDIDAGKVFSLK